MIGYREYNTNKYEKCNPYISTDSWKKIDESIDGQ